MSSARGTRSGSGGAAHARARRRPRFRGLEYLNTELPTATAFPDGEAAFLLRKPTPTPRVRAARSGDGQAWRDTGAGSSRTRTSRSACSAPSSGGSAGLAFGFKALRRLGRDGLAAFTGDLLLSSRDWLERTFASERAHGLLAPWVLHTGLGPDAATSGFMTQVIAVAVQEGGMPVPRGGGAGSPTRSCG